MTTSIFFSKMGRMKHNPKRVSNLKSILKNRNEWLFDYEEVLKHVMKSEKKKKKVSFSLPNEPNPHDDDDLRVMKNEPKPDEIIIISDDDEEEKKEEQIAKKKKKPTGKTNFPKHKKFDLSIEDFVIYHKGFVTFFLE